jgi:SnoaL-like domain
MSRTFAFFCLAVSTAFALASGYGPSGFNCGARTDRLGPAEFRAVLDSVAAAWNTNRADLAASCFTEGAVYLEPPNRQLYRGRAGLREFFAGSIAPARTHRMRWHAVAFDSVQQVGFGEYTYRGQRNYHGIVVLHLEGGLIRSWREYQYESALTWEQFVGPSR